MLTGLVGAAAAQQPTELSVSTQPSLFPAFDESVTDYVARCEPSNEVQVSVSTPANTTASVDNGPQREGTFTHTVSPLSAGERFEITTASGGDMATYFVRCLPSDFPMFTASRTGATQAEWYAVTPGIFGTPPPGVSRNYAAFFDSNGVPMWWLRVSANPLDAKLLPNGHVAWLHSGLAEERRLDGSTVRTLTIENDADRHDIQQLPNGNYVLGRYVTRSDVDMSSCGGSTSRELIDAEIQELTPSGALVWSWRASDHIPFSEVAATWEDRCTGDGDIYHWNSVEPDGDGYVLSFRHLDAVYRIDQATGAIDWKLGGEPRAESLTVVGDSLSAVGTFGGQHDARVLGDGTVTVHDNGSQRDRPPRAVRYAIDEGANTATLLEDVRDPDAPGSSCCGSTRRLPGGNWVSAWGANPYVTEQTPTGEPVFKLSFPDGLVSYRANPVLSSQLSRSALRAGMDEQYPRSPPTPLPPSDTTDPPDGTTDPPDGTAAPPEAFTAPPDTTAPQPLIGGPAAQRLDRTVKVRVSCRESCEVGATGRVVARSAAKDTAMPRRGGRRLSVRLKPASASLAAGEQRTLELKLSNKKLKMVERATKPPRAEAKAQLRVHATDAAGNEATQKWTVKLRR